MSSCQSDTGGVTASYAMLGALHIAEPGAVIGFAGARVIEQTVAPSVCRKASSAPVLRRRTAWSHGDAAAADAPRPWRGCAIVTGVAERAGRRLIRCGGKRAWPAIDRRP